MEINSNRSSINVFRYLLVHEFIPPLPPVGEISKIFFLFIEIELNILK